MHTSGAAPRTIRFGLLTSVVALMTFVSAYGQQVTVELDPAQTTIRWTLGATLHTVHGTFKAKSGKIQLDLPAEAAGGTIVIDATSGESGNSGRDEKMHKDVIESGKYPDITFTAQRVLGKFVSQGASTVQLQGVLRVHGADHPLTLPVALIGNGNALTAKTSFEVPFVEWGMRDPSTFMLKVNKVVRIEVAAVGRVANQ